MIPCHNYARFVSDAVHSAEAQSLPPHEVIVVDDGSTDEIDVVASKFGPKVRCIRIENSGVSRARNLGAEQATGDWLAFLDADDYWLPSKLLRQWEWLQGSCQPEVKAIQCGYTVADAELRPIGPSRGVSEVSRRRALLMHPEFTLLSSSLLVSREVFLQLGGFQEDLSTSADFDLGLRLCRELRLGSMEDPLVLYRSHGEQMHLAPKRLRCDVDVVLARELRSEGFRMRRRSRAAAALLEANLHIAAGSWRGCTGSLMRAVAQWPPSLVGFGRAALRGLASGPASRVTPIRD